MITLADLLRGLPGSVGLPTSRGFVAGIRPNGQLLNMPPRLRWRIRRRTHLRVDLYEGEGRNESDMSTTYRYSPRTPGCVLLYFLIRSLGSKFRRLLHRPSASDIQSIEREPAN